jgi:hypothetical protein
VSRSFPALAIHLVNLVRFISLFYNRVILGREHWRRAGPLKTVNQPPLEI